MANSIPITSIREKIGRLPINADNFFLYNDLLDLPYFIYAPILERLVSGELSIDDFRKVEGVDSDKVERDLRRERKVRDKYPTPEEFKKQLLSYIQDGQTPPVKIIGKVGNSIALAENQEDSSIENEKEFKELQTQLFRTTTRL